AAGFASTEERGDGMRLLLGLAGLVLFGLIFEVLPVIGLVSPDDVPPTSRILSTLADQLTQDRFLTALLDTLRTWVLGLAIAVAARIRYLLWPTALPYAVTGIRLATSVALILTITGELIIGSPGLGKEIAVAQASGATATMYAMVLITALFGVVANVLTRTAE